MQPTYRVHSDMKVIYKYLATSKSVTINSGYSIKALQVQDGLPMLWIEMPIEGKTDTRFLQIFGTGHPIPDKAIWWGTWQEAGYVWHVYDVTNCSHR